MDCAETDHNEYYWIMHGIFIVSLPIYSIAIIALLQTKSPYFEKYKLFLIWHTSTNLLAELLNSWFLIPVVHVNLPILRFTGILSHWGFSGLFQFFVIGTMIYLTAYSVLEMFMFRFRASLFNYKSTYFYIYLKANIYLFRFAMLCFLTLNICTYSFAIDQQTVNKYSLSLKFPDAPSIILCYTVIASAPFADPATMFNVLIWLSVVIVTLTSTIATTVYLQRNLRENEHYSETVVRMHKMLLITLSIQTAIHGIMLGIPNALFIFAAFFGVRHESVAKLSFIFLTTHGLASTIAMVVLTKPIKIAAMELFKCRSGDKVVETDNRRMSRKL
ncbi:Serpentine Receptor, class H [Caenorhabditis elegans]|uniref:Serpentine Receptor, class H n=1 Tax=Caenorhabditis elegans TaxID=6239 RepID=G5EBN3_CAEEL|nr:Serpentine Receptor, class H [Caenorhabditis elegans]CAA99797.2 Serpentine Receptor, class H [Caenorhabditis elegans]|eukprot:NP_506622.2 Serpentine Receptor, class H [Caenorhabditis elegans]